MEEVRIAVTGDVMLGRLVDELVVGHASLQPEDLWGDVLPLLLDADVRLANLECVISAKGQVWSPASKTFHFRARPRAIDFLKHARIDGVTLANNHVLDYGPEALIECLQLLDENNIKRTGAGMTLGEAMFPIVLQTSGGPVAVLAVTDNEPEWEATDCTPGIHYVAYDRHGLTAPYRARLARVIEQTKTWASLLVVSAHFGPNWGTPSTALQAAARDVIDLGADVYWGHSNHTVQGIEIYRQRPILYSTGDFIDDYLVDECQRNDLSFLFLLDVEQKHIARIRLYPVRIENCRVRRAAEADAMMARRVMQARCADFGTTAVFEGTNGLVRVT